jgi:hypothetical protein
MDKGEAIMPTPEGILSTTTGPVDITPVEEVVEVSIIEEAIEDDLPELS